MELVTSVIFLISRYLCFVLNLVVRNPSALLDIERAVTSGTMLVLYNIEEKIDSLFMPLIYNIASTVAGSKPTGKLIRMYLSILSP